MNTSVEGMIAHYVAAWNEVTLAGYQREFAKCWAAGALYSDPFGEYKGVEALAGFAHISLGIIPNRTFSILEQPEHHHHYGRYAWAVAFDGQTNTGYDFFEFNERFEITRLVSFFTLPDDYPLEKLG